MFSRKLNVFIVHFTNFYTNILLAYHSDVYNKFAFDSVSVRIGTPATVFGGFSWRRNVARDSLTVCLLPLAPQPFAHFALFKSSVGCQSVTLHSSSTYNKSLSEADVKGCRQRIAWHIPKILCFLRQHDRIQFTLCERGVTM